MVLRLLKGGPVPRGPSRGGPVRTALPAGRAVARAPEICRCDASGPQTPDGVRPMGVSCADWQHQKLPFLATFGQTLLFLGRKRSFSASVGS